jgi:hypothetical protein
MTNNKQQTAVEWLEERLILSFGDELKPLIGFFIIAKEMEREQIITAWVGGKGFLNGEQYYNETYGGGEQ